MKLDINYTDDKRWSLCCEAHKDHGYSPNYFIGILYEYKDKIKNLDEINVAVETGTYEGETTEFFADHFDSVYTVELNVTDNHYRSGNLMPIYKELKSKYPNINFYQGNSATALAEMISNVVDQRLIVLLDAHNGDTASPVIQELQAVKDTSNRSDHVIIVDDCNCLGQPGWPTESQFHATLLSINPNYKIINTGLGNGIHLIYEEC